MKSLQHLRTERNARDILRSEVRRAMACGVGRSAEKTEVKLLERTYYSPLPLVLNWFAVCLGKGDVVHVQALPFQGL